jgi:hypothetical protein
LKNTSADNLDVLSAAVPVGWARQTSEDWQVAAFVAPLGHRKDGGWYWETLGGIFARHLRSDSVAWIFGVYFDVSTLEDFYTPYAGATWILNERWTLSAVLPWPAVTYAPSPRTLFRLGIAPSGTSWSVETETARPRVSFSSWNLGLSIEHRVFGNIWLGAEAGYSGLHGLTVVGRHWESPELRLDDTPYALVRINFRPPTASGT